MVDLVSGRSVDLDSPGLDSMHAYTIAAFADGTVKGWGSNPHGQLEIPVSLSDVIVLSSSNRHCLAPHRSGKVTAWGANLDGAWIALRPRPAWQGVDLDPFQGMDRLVVGHYHVFGIPGNEDPSG